MILCYTATKPCLRFTLYVRMLMALAATIRIVTSDMRLSSIISIFARIVIGATSVVLNAVAVEYERYR